jgi:hypothetical protein
VVRLPPVHQKQARQEAKLRERKVARQHGGAPLAAADAAANMRGPDHADVVGAVAHAQGDGPRPASHQLDHLRLLDGRDAAEDDGAGGRAQREQRGAAARRQRVVQGAALDDQTDAARRQGGQEALLLQQLLLLLQLQLQLQLLGRRGRRRVVSAAAAQRRGPHRRVRPCAGLRRERQRQAVRARAAPAAAARAAARAQPRVREPHLCQLRGQQGVGGVREDLGALLVGGRLGVAARGRGVDGLGLGVLGVAGGRG